MSATFIFKLRLSVAMGKLSVNLYYSQSVNVSMCNVTPKLTDRWTK